MLAWSNLAHISKRNRLSHQYRKFFNDPYSQYRNQWHYDSLKIKVSQIQGMEDQKYSNMRSVRVDQVKILSTDQNMLVQ